MHLRWPQQKALLAHVSLLSLLCFFASLADANDQQGKSTNATNTGLNSAQKNLQNASKERQEAQQNRDRASAAKADGAPSLAEQYEADAKENDEKAKAYEAQAAADIASALKNSARGDQVAQGGQGCCGGGGGGDKGGMPPMAPPAPQGGDDKGGDKQQPPPKQDPIVQQQPPPQMAQNSSDNKQVVDLSKEILALQAENEKLQKANSSSKGTSSDDALALELEQVRQGQLAQLKALEDNAEVAAKQRNGQGRTQLTIADTLGNSSKSSKHSLGLASAMNVVKSGESRGLMEVGEDREEDDESVTKLKKSSARARPRKSKSTIADKFSIISIRLGSK